MDITDFGSTSPYNNIARILELLSSFGCRPVSCECIGMSLPLCEIIEIPKQVAQIMSERVRVVVSHPYAMALFIKFKSRYHDWRTATRLCPTNMY